MFGLCHNLRWSEFRESGTLPGRHDLQVLITLSSFNTEDSALKLIQLYESHRVQEYLGYLVTDYSPVGHVICDAWVMPLWVVVECENCREPASRLLMARYQLMAIPAQPVMQSTLEVIVPATAIKSIGCRRVV